MSMDTEDPWAPTAPPPSIFDADDPGILDRTVELPDLPPPPDQANRQTDQASRPGRDQAGRQAEPGKQAGKLLDQATGKQAVPVRRPVVACCRAVPAGWRARSLARQAEVEEPRRAWREEWLPAIEATRQTALSGDRAALAKHKEWLADEASFQAVIDQRQKESDRNLHVRWGVITVTVLFCYFAGRYWLWPLLLVPPVMLAWWVRNIGLEGQQADRAADQAGKRANRQAGNGQADQANGQATRQDQAGRPGMPGGLPGDQAGRQAGNGQQASGQAGPGNDQADKPLHRRASELQDALRHHRIIKPDEKISSGVPTVMTIGDQPPNGTAFVVTLPKSCPASRVVGRLHDVATWYDTTDDKVILLPYAKAGSNRVLWVWLCDRHPLGGGASRSCLEELAEVNVYDGWIWGYSMHGEECIMKCAGDRLLIGGAPGAGKSASACLIPLAFSLDPDTRSLILDPEASGTLRPFSKVATLIRGGTETDLEEMTKALEHEAYVVIPQRQAEMERVRVEQKMQLDGDDLTEAISRDQRYHLETVLIYCAEVSSLLNASNRKLAQRAEAALAELMRRSRKYGYTIVLDTQKFTGDNVSSAIAAMATSKYMMACTTDAMADALIPDWRILGMDPRQAIKPTDGDGGGTPGAGYLMGRSLASPAAPWVLMRTDYASMTAVEGVVDRAYRLRKARRPQLLPDWDGNEGVPAAQPAPTPDRGPAVLALAPDDPEHLEAIAGVFREDELELWSSTIIARLREGYPVDPTYRDLTPRGMNRFLEPFGLATKVVHENDHPKKGLKLADVNDALERTYNAAITQDPAFALRSDEKVPLTSTSTLERTQAPDGPESGPIAKRLLSEVPLSDYREPGGFS